MFMPVKYRVLVVAGLALLVAVGYYLIVYFLLTIGPSHSAQPTTVISVETVYPGANAQVVADSVAVPIEREVDGVEGMVSMWSECGNDGSYTLRVAFPAGVDVNIVQVMVQNRVALAEPALPDPVKRHGVTVKKKSSQALLLAALYSPDNRFDTTYLGNYAALQLRDTLVRVAGVGDVILVGHPGRSLRVLLDPHRLTAHSLTVADVLAALQNRKGLVVWGAPVKDKAERVAFSVTVPGRLSDIEPLVNTFLKAGAAGQSVYLRDVAVIEGRSQATGAELNGKPAIVLAIYPLPNAPLGKVRGAVRDRLAELRGRFPAGLDLDIPFDLQANATAASNYLRVDVELPASASRERTLRVLQGCETVLAETPGVKTVLAICGPPFACAESQGCILVDQTAVDGKDPGTEERLQSLRARLQTRVPDAVLRLCDVSGSGSFPMGGYPIELTIYGPEPEAVRKLAKELSRRLGKTGKLADLGAHPRPEPSLRLCLDVQPSKAAALDVELGEVLNTLEVSLGSLRVNAFDRARGTWQIGVQVRAGERLSVEAIKMLKVRNKRGESVPLGALLTARMEEAPQAVIRFNTHPAVRLTANPATGVSLADARDLCESLAEAARQDLKLSADYRLAWVEP
jgi:multidrug efflux pump subunit AcrB